LVEGNSKHGFSLELVEPSNFYAGLACSGD
jgi:hypothetical protein